MRWRRVWSRLRSLGARNRKERTAAWVAFVPLAGTWFAANLAWDAFARFVQQYVPLWILVLGVLPLAAIQLVRATSKQPPEPEVPPLTFPAKTEPLVGRDSEVAEVVLRAGQSGLVPVKGPAGVGTSTVAINAAWELAPSTERQRYADLSGQDPGRVEDALSVARHVLRVVRGDPGEVETEAAAAARLAEALQATDQVLVIDDVRRWEQVSWLPHEPDAKIIVAGQLEGAEPGHEPVEILPLSAAKGLELLRTRLSPADPRLDEDEKSADHLAELFLRLPATVLIVAAWLAKNRRASLTGLVEWLLHGPHDDAGVRENLRKELLRGTLRTAKWLLPVLAHLPVEEVEEATVLALTRRKRQDIRRSVQELRDRRLLEPAHSPSRIRVEETARLITERPQDMAVYRGRLVEYLAERAEHYADLLPGEDARRWFSVEDTALLTVLRDGEPEARLGACYWRIADALDTWHALERRQSDRKEAAGALAAAARALGDEQARRTARLRLAVIELNLGEVDDANHRVLELEREIPQDERPPQLHLLRAAIDLVTVDDLRVVEEALVRYRQSLPSSDLAGRAMAMSNLCLLVLHEGGRDVPENLLDVADWALQAGDAGAAAHAHEVRALAQWNRDLVQEARSGWETAAARYLEAGDSLGHARCQVHIAATELDDDPQEAAARLTRARRRLPNTGVERALAGLYLATAEPALAAEHAADGLRALAPWPSTATPPAISEIRRRLKELG